MSGIDCITTAQGRKKVNADSLKDIAIYLSGIEAGKGNLSPLGTNQLDDLWDAIAYLRGSNMFTSDREEKYK